MLVLGVTLYTNFNFLHTGCFCHKVGEWAFVWPVMDVRLLNAVILVNDTWGQEGNCGLLEAAKGVKKWNLKNPENNKLCLLLQTNCQFSSYIPQKRSADGHDREASADRFWDM